MRISDNNKPEVSCKAGIIRGRLRGNMAFFEGIPFAEAPVGERRFKAPMPKEPFTEAYEAVTQGMMSIQNGAQVCDNGVLCSDKLDSRYSEDCLNLNIWAPVKPGKYPVVFYIHGGGHFEGSNTDEYADGGRFAHGRDIVFIAANYRLGALGYLYLGDILGDEFEDSGSCGLLDQLLALKWVHNNIEAFNGDPSDVTLWGQSAGAKSVGNLMVTPGASGLFHKAILESGATQCIRDRQTASALTRFTLSELGLDIDKTVNEASRAKIKQTLIHTSPILILEAQIRAYAKANIAHIFGPVLDGKNIVQTPEEYIRSGKLADIPVMIGYAADEMLYASSAGDMDDEEVRRNFRCSFGLHSRHVYDSYRGYCKSLPETYAYGRTMTEYVYGIGCMRLTELLAGSLSRVWSYRWDFKGKGRATHFSDMAYIFGYTSDENYKGYPSEFGFMADIMSGCWLSFILNGDPNHTLIPQWTPFDHTAAGERLIFDSVTHTERIDLQYTYDPDFPMQVIKL